MRDYDDRFFVAIVIYILCAIVLNLNWWMSNMENKHIEEVIYYETKPVQIEKNDTQESYELLTLPAETRGEVKTYMDYRTITNTSSPQYALQKLAYTDKNGYRKIGDSYLIALGSAYGTNIGDKYYITLDNGYTFQAILGDCKADMHTDCTNRYVTSNGNIIEYIVDTDKMHNLPKIMGDVSYGGFEGEIIQILKVGSED